MAVLTTLTACGGRSAGATGGPTQTPTPTPSPTPTAKLDSISVSPASPSLSLGASQQFTAKGKFADGTTQDITSNVAWTSSDPAVATINAAGLAATAGVGSTTITASSNNVSGTAQLSVHNATSSDSVGVVYVIASDGTNRGLDTNGKIAASVAAWEGWLASQTGGRKYQLDGQGTRFFQSPKTGATLAKFGAGLVDELGSELAAAGFNDPNKKYLIYYDGDSGGAGCGTTPVGGKYAAVYLQGTFPDPSVPPCSSNPLGGSASNPTFLDFVAVHELTHAMGMVPNCAPHSTGNGHVNDSPNDLMYAGNQPWTPSVLDVGHNDYFQANIAGCPDLSNSPFLK